MSESVAQRLAAPHWLPNTLPLTAWPNGERADTMGKRTDLKIWTVTVDPCPCYVSIAPTPSAFGESGQGNGIQGSMSWSTSLRAADYNLHACRALKMSISSLYARTAISGVVKKMKVESSEVKIEWT